MADPTPSASRPPSATAAPDALVIGAGPGGLAAAAAMRQRGMRPLVVERAEQLGASWRRHYDRLHLHTTRRLSALPGLPIPRQFGRWVGRDDVVRYLELYTEYHDLDIATGIEVSRVEKAESAGSAQGAEKAGSAEQAEERGGTGKAETGWRLPATGGRVLTSPVVVVATGHNHTPYIPSWTGRNTFTGDLLHASAYRNADPYKGKDVLVVGVGNTGAEIAVDLAEGGAGRVRLAVRTPPHILRRSTMGWPAQASGIVCRRLPVSVVDKIAPYVERAGVPDLTEFGLPRPENGLYSRVLEGAIPVQDVGLVAAVRARKVEPVAAVEEFDGETVRLADGSEIRPDVVIAATGYRRGLESLVGHLGVLDDRGRPVVHGAKTSPGAPGLYFTGFTNPISGMFREMAIDARRIARAATRGR